MQLQTAEHPLGHLWVCLKVIPWDSPEWLHVTKENNPEEWDFGLRKFETTLEIECRLLFDIERCLAQ